MAGVEALEQGGEQAGVGVHLVLAGVEALEQVDVEGGEQAGVGGGEQAGEEALEEAEVPLAATGTS